MKLSLKHIRFVNAVLTLAVTAIHAAPIPFAQALAEPASAMRQNHNLDSSASMLLSRTSRLQRRTHSGTLDATPLEPEAVKELKKPKSAVTENGHAFEVHLKDNDGTKSPDYTQVFDQQSDQREDGSNGVDDLETRTTDRVLKGLLGSTVESAGNLLRHTVDGSTSVHPDGGLSKPTPHFEFGSSSIATRPSPKDAGQAPGSTHRELTQEQLALLNKYRKLPLLRIRDEAVAQQVADARKKRKTITSATWHSANRQDPSSPQNIYRRWRKRIRDQIRRAKKKEGNESKVEQLSRQYDSLPSAASFRGLQNQKRQKMASNAISSTDTRNTVLSLQGKTSQEATPTSLDEHRQIFTSGPPSDALALTLGPNGVRPRSTRKPLPEPSRDFRLAQPQPQQHELDLELKLAPAGHQQ